MITLSPYNAPLSTYELLSSIEAAVSSLKPHLVQNYYEIENIRQSENAWLLFTHHERTKQRVVIKILRKYEDIRYKLGTSCERQLCQCEALAYNRIFTQGVHIGLARICDFDLQGKRIGIGTILVEPDEKKLDADAEYALLMDELPKSRRLDTLLKEGNRLLNQCGDKKYHQLHMDMLTKYMVHIHTDEDIERLTQLSVADSGVQWGSVDQLREKLIHNFAFVDRSLITNKDYQYAAYYAALEKVLYMLQNDLMPILTDHEKYFNRRIQEKRVRRCHGDLKARNIWISPCAIDDVEPWRCVKVLDAVDFNSVYSNIDILSDFAMLVIDVQARTRSSALADAMIKEYLYLTQQEDMASKLVLDYYLVEKAFIGAIVNIIYDNWPSLGLSFLDVAERRMRDLVRRKERQHSNLFSSKKVLSTKRLALSRTSAELELV